MSRGSFSELLSTSCGNSACLETFGPCGNGVTLKPPEYSVLGVFPHNLRNNFGAILAIGDTAIIDPIKVIP